MVIYNNHFKSVLRRYKHIAVGVIRFFNYRLLYAKFDAIALMFTNTIQFESFVNHLQRAKIKKRVELLYQKNRAKT